MNEPSKTDRVLGGLWGSIVGDALGVPVEFQDRSKVQENHVVGMRGYGTHRQPPGTWSDDGALLLCTTDSLLHSEFDIEDMGQRFVRWMNEGLWTAWGEAFDVGVATSDALIRISEGASSREAGSKDEFSNGNGSLMRILPVSLRFANEPCEILADRVSDASQITHGHARSKMACAFYSLLVQSLLTGMPPELAFQKARNGFIKFYADSASLCRFSDLIDNNVGSMREYQINSDGYVIHTLTASVWCLLTTHTFEECVLKAVNLGVDTDTTGCVAGGLAGITYGFESIPADWISQLARREDLDRLFNQFAGLVVSGQKLKS